MKRIFAALRRFRKFDLADSATPGRILLKHSPRPRILFEYGQEGYNADFLLDVLALEWGLEYAVYKGDLCTIALPKGWYTKLTDGRTNRLTIYDRQRRPRGHLLNEFYSRIPHLYVHCRYHSEVVYPSGQEDQLAFKVIDEATGAAVMVSSPVDMGPDATILENGVRIWLDSTYPAYRNPFAYWDGPAPRRVSAPRSAGRRKTLCERL